MYNNTIIRILIKILNAIDSLKSLIIYNCKKFHKTFIKILKLYSK